MVGTQPGGGLIRAEDAAKSVSTIGTDFMRKQAPSATAFDMVSLLPGANVSSSDALGFSPQTNITVRGLGGDSLGYVLEGMPLNDIAYYNGYPGQFADTENYQSVSLAQGTADLDSPVLNAAGGTDEHVPARSLHAGGGICRCLIRVIQHEPAVPAAGYRADRAYRHPGFRVLFPWVYR
ncbi:hypothetical protein AA11826_0523 [Komagataeibacter oboediens DSM 11826]|nr:hypothetical protein AA11826_0523 [Komagataeibacter oboediens DSM 11826]